MSEFVDAAALASAGSDYCICKNLSGGCYNGPC